MYPKFDAYPPLENIHSKEISAYIERRGKAVRFLEGNRSKDIEKYLENVKPENKKGVLEFASNMLREELEKLAIYYNTSIPDLLIAYDLFYAVREIFDLYSLSYFIHIIAKEEFEKLKNVK